MPILYVSLSIIIFFLYLFMCFLLISCYLPASFYLHPCVSSKYPCRTYIIIFLISSLYTYHLRILANYHFLLKVIHVYTPKLLVYFILFYSSFINRYPHRIPVKYHFLFKANLHYVYFPCLRIQPNILSYTVVSNLSSLCILY
jgi:hypothetical protein